MNNLRATINSKLMTSPARVRVLLRNVRPFGAWTYIYVCVYVFVSSGGTEIGTARKPRDVIGAPCLSVTWNKGDLFDLTDIAYM